MNTNAIRPWYAASYLNTPDDMARYLEAAFEDGDVAVIVGAFGDIVRAKGNSEVARDTGLERESLYEPLSADGNLEFATVLEVIEALGLRLHVSPASDTKAV